MSTPFFTTDHVTVHHGDCLDVMRALPDASVDAIVTDPPYGLGFMGKAWDSLPPGLPWATECLRVLKPGGHLLAFGGSRTWHRLAVAVEDAGFEMRDSIAWLYGSGFPKSLDVSKAIDKARDDSEEIAQVRAFLNGIRLDRGIKIRDINSHFAFSQTGGGPASKWTTNMASPAVPTWDQWLNLKSWLAFGDSFDPLVRKLNARKGQGSDEWQSRAEATYAGRPGMARSWRDGDGWTGAASKGGGPVRDSAKSWQGWGTALKPAFEPIVVGRKPLDGTVAANVLAWGTGALNIDGCRVESDRAPQDYTVKRLKPGATLNREGGNWRPEDADAPTFSGSTPSGRWPTNVVLDGSQADELDRQTGILTSGANPTRRGSDKLRDAYGDFKGQEECIPARGADSGGPSRFFPTFRYQAKAPTSERPRDGEVAHPTVKPLDLMRWLVRLVTPPGGVVLEPFAGSGTTAEACVIEGFRCIAIEREAAYLPLIVRRLKKPIEMVLNFDGDAA